MFNPSLYRGDFDVRQGVSGPGMGTVQIFPANPTAVYRNVVNTNATSVLLSLNSDASGGDGFALIPKDGNWDAFWERHGLLVTLPWYYYAGAHTGPIYWIEMTFQPPQ